MEIAPTVKFVKNDKVKYTGAVKEKGYKNAERVFELLKFSKKNRGLKNARMAAAPLLKNIALKNIVRARKNAVKVNRVMKKIV